MAITKIAQVDVGAGGAATIAFSSIPGTYTDLYLVASIRSTQAGFIGASMQLNSTSPTGIGIFGNGNSVASYGFVTPSIAGSDKTANTFNNLSFYVANYTSAVAKTASCDNVAENNASASAQEFFAMAYSTVTSAVTSLTIAGLTGLPQYSSATLYGISNAGATGATVS
jgi:hypothetical protein